MRAIIIDDKDARTLLDQLRLQNATGGPWGANTRHVMKTKGLTEKDYQLIAEDIHSRFHYTVTCWLQDQGANVVR